MITIFLSVNIQCLLHLHIDSFLIYFVTKFPLKKQKHKSTGTKRETTCKASTSRRRCITENKQSDPKQHLSVGYD